MDKFRLEYEMKRRNVSVKMLCDHIGVARTTFYRKCNGKSEFTLTEIVKIVDFLGLDSPMDIFFANKVS